MLTKVELIWPIEVNSRLKYYVRVGFASSLLLQSSNSAVKCSRLTVFKSHNVVYYILAGNVCHCAVVLHFVIRIDKECGNELVELRSRAL